MNYEVVRQKLEAQFPDLLKDWDTPFGMLTFTADVSVSNKVMQYLYNDEELKFRFLTDLTAIHYPDRTGEELCVVYLLHNMVDNIRLRYKVYVPITKPDIETATNVFATANWLEREAYDFFGVNFTGHPNLTRIMNPDEMDYFPMRKEYPMEDPTRRDKDDAMFGR